MKFIAILSIIFFLSILFSAHIFNKRHLFFFAGIEFVFIGYFLGPDILGIINTDMQSQLKPLLYCGLGWIGLFYGMQFKWNNLKRNPVYMYLFSGIHSLLLLLIFYLFWLFLLPRFRFYMYTDVWIIAATAAVSSPAAIAHFRTRYKIPPDILRWTRFISSMDDLLPLVCIGILLSYPFHISLYNNMPVFFFKRLFLIISVSALLGYLFSLLVITATTRHEIFLYTIGMIIFTSGVSFYLHLSPLLISFLMGLFFTQISRRSEIIFTVFNRLEHTFYLFFLLLVGVGFKPVFSNILTPLIVFLLMHVFLKIIIFYILSLEFRGDDSPDPGIGWGLIAQGSMALAFLVNYREVVAGPHANRVFSLLLYAIMLNEILGTFCLKRLVKKQ